MNLELGQIIKRLRKTNNLKQQSVADYLCISRPTYIRYERNEVEMPLSKLFDLALLYDFEITVLIKLIEEAVVRDFADKSEEMPNPLIETVEMKGCA